MKVEKNKILLKTDEWKFKVKTKGRRMKIYIKLNKTESERWSAIKSAVVPDDNQIGNEEFAKIMLFRGLNAFMEDLHTAMDEMSDEEREQVLADAGIDSETEIEIPVRKTDENADDSNEQPGEDVESSSEEQEN